VLEHIAKRRQEDAVWTEVKLVKNLHLLALCGFVMFFVTAIPMHLVFVEAREYFPEGFQKGFASRCAWPRYMMSPDVPRELQLKYFLSGYGAVHHYC
jgi:hypothetical protein